MARPSVYRNRTVFFGLAALCAIGVVGLGLRGRNGEPRYSAGTVVASAFSVMVPLDWDYELQPSDDKDAPDSSAYLLEIHPANRLESIRIVDGIFPFGRAGIAGAKEEVNRWREDLIKEGEKIGAVTTEVAGRNALVYFYCREGVLKEKGRARMGFIVLPSGNCIRFDDGELIEKSALMQQLWSIFESVIEDDSRKSKAGLKVIGGAFSCEMPLSFFGSQGLTKFNVGKQPAREIYLAAKEGPGALILREDVSTFDARESETVAKMVEKWREVRAREKKGPSLVTSRSIGGETFYSFDYRVQGKPNINTIGALTQGPLKAIHVVRYCPPEKRDVNESLDAIMASVRMMRR